MPSTSDDLPHKTNAASAPQQQERSQTCSHSHIVQKMSVGPTRSNCSFGLFRNTSSPTTPSVNHWRESRDFEYLHKWTDQRACESGAGKRFETKCHNLVSRFLKDTLSTQMQSRMCLGVFVVSILVPCAHSYTPRYSLYASV